MLENMGNLTFFTEFFLVDISSSRELQIFQGLLFLLIYLGAMAGNILTITAIVTDPHLHSPMYYFISNLSFIDLCCISVSVPKLIVNSLTDSKSISLKECAAQIFLYILFASIELALLVVMSYDRYVAICHPLYYGLTITPRLCIQATGGSWGSGLVYSTIHTSNLFRLPFTRSNVINQYLCDIPQIMRISSSYVQFSESVILAISACIVLVFISFLVMSYSNIFSTVLKIHSVEARNKSLSTCTPQLVILLLFIISGMIAVLGPIANEASLKNLLTAIFYIMVPPFMNPIIYSLRNKEINTAIGRMFKRCFKFPSRHFLE